MAQHTHCRSVHYSFEWMGNVPNEGLQPNVCAVIGVRACCVKGDELQV